MSWIQYTPAYIGFDIADGYDMDEDTSPPPIPKTPARYCNHSWKPILLLTTTVYNCEHCDMKKETYDKECLEIVRGYGI